jgi:Uma2 family endonuclease
MPEPPNRLVRELPESTLLKSLHALARGVPHARTRRQHVLPQEIYLVIEVSDTTVKYDSERKLLAYENARIPEYWMVDVPAKAIRAFRLDQGNKYQETRSTEGSIAVQAFPDVVVHLQNLF